MPQLRWVYESATKHFNRTVLSFIRMVVGMDGTASSKAIIALWGEDVLVAVGFPNAEHNEILREAMLALGIDGEPDVTGGTEFILAKDGSVSFSGESHTLGKIPPGTEPLLREGVTKLLNMK